MKWYIQVYDDEGYACKMLRVFKGTKEEAYKYVEERFGLVDLMYGRTTKVYSSRKFTEDSVPLKIDVESEKE